MDGEPRENKKIFKIAVLFFVVLAFFLYSVLYLAARSFWLDEAMLALSIVESSGSPFERLPLHNQSSPWGFVIFAKLFGYLFGIHDLSFRLPGILFYYVSIFVFIKYLYQRFGFANALVVGILVLSNPILLRYSTEFKHYIFEASLTFLLITFYSDFKIEGKHAESLYMLSLFAAVFIGISNIFIVGSIFFVEVISWRNYPVASSKKKRWIAAHALFVILFVIWYVVSIRLNLENNVLNYPHVYDVDFQPQKLLKLGYWFRLMKILRESTPPMHLAIPGLILAFAFLFQHKTRSHDRRGMLLLPLFAYLLIYLLNIIGIYPILKARHFLFFIPLIYLVIAYVINDLRQFPFKNLARSAFFAIMLLPSLLKMAESHLKRTCFFQEMKPVLKTIGQSDDLVVYFSAQPAYEWYRKSLFPDLPDPVNPLVETKSGPKIPIEDIKTNTKELISKRGAWPSITISTITEGSDYYDAYLFDYIKNRKEVFVLFSHRDDRNLRKKIELECKITTASKAEGVILFKVNCQPGL